MLPQRPARAASAATAPLHRPCSSHLFRSARHQAPCALFRKSWTLSPIIGARATPPSSPSSPREDPTGASDDEPGRRVAMAMAASWGKKAAAPLPHPVRSAAAGLQRPPDSGGTAASSERLSRAIAASARAAALSSQLRGAHARLASATPQALAAAISELAAAADDLDAGGPAGGGGAGAGGGARTGTLEFFSYVLPASPFLPAWRSAVRAALPRMTREQLADAVYSLGRLPYFPAAPLPIGFGTPRYARPLAASEPDEWEALLEEASAAWLAAPALGEEEQEAQEEEQEAEQEQDEASGVVGGGGGGRAARALEARLLLGLALSRRWAGVRVGDAWLASREAQLCLQRALSELPTGEGAGTAAAATAATAATARTAGTAGMAAPAGAAATLSAAARLAAALLQVRGAPPLLLARAFFDETAAPAAEGAPWPASWAAGRQPPAAPGSTAVAAPRAGPQPPPAPPPPLAADGGRRSKGEGDPPPSPLGLPSPPSSPLHGGGGGARPAPAPQKPPSALCAALSPRQVQRAARGLVYLGSVPGDAWLGALASASRCALGCGGLDARELAALRDALRFFAAERRGGAAAFAASAGGGTREQGDRTGLAEAVAVLDEWCVGGSGAF